MLFPDAARTKIERKMQIQLPVESVGTEGEKERGSGIERAALPSGNGEHCVRMELERLYNELSKVIFRGCQK